MFNFSNSTSLDKLAYLGTRLQQSANNLQVLESYYDGTQPTAFLPLDVAKQLQNRVRTLNVNYPRLIVSTLVERLKVAGFRLDGEPESDADVWKAWLSNQMQLESNFALRDALTLGTGYISVWADANGNPSVSVESPKQIYAYRNPQTRQIEGVLKSWGEFDDLTSTGESYSTLYLPDRVETYANKSSNPVASGWTLIDVVPNPLGVITIVQLRNASNILDVNGHAEFEPVLGLCDALGKVMLDSLAASDATGFVRRWVTGLTIKVDDNGVPVQQFCTDKDSLWVTENSDAKFGQFDAAALDGFERESNMLQRQIAAIAGLPLYLTGVASTAPNSADAIRAANMSLTSKATEKTELFAPAFARVAQLIKAVETGRRADDIPVTVVWNQIENRSQSMATDSVSKLVAAGVPLALAVEIELGWTPDQVAQLTNTNIITSEGEAA